MPKFTDTMVRGYKFDKREELKDDICPGLWLRVGAGPNGTKTWLLRVRIDGKQQSITLGSFTGTATGMGVADARRKASEIRDKVKAGQPLDDGKPAPAPSVPTFAEVAEAYLASPTINGTPSYKDKMYRIRKYLISVLGAKPITAITRADLFQILEDLVEEDMNTTAAKVKQSALAIMDYAVNKHSAIMPNNVFAGIKGFTNKSSRDRYLSRAEIKALWAHLSQPGNADDPIARCIKFILATGQRRTECALINASEVDAENRRWNLPAERTKNGQPHVLPLTDWHMELLGKPDEKTGFYFVSRRKDVDVIHPKSVTHYVNTYAKFVCPANRFTVHDLRRTFITHLAELGADSDSVKRCVNHTFGDVTSQHYNRFAYIPAKLKVMEMWRDFLMEVTK